MNLIKPFLILSFSYFNSKIEIKITVFISFIAVNLKVNILILFAGELPVSV